MGKNKEIGKAVEQLAAEGKSAAEIALAVSQMYETAVNKAREEGERKLRERMVESARQKIRARIFKGMKLNKPAQLAWLYSYADEHADEIRNDLLGKLKSSGGRVFVRQPYESGTVIESLPSESDH